MLYWVLFQSYHWGLSEGVFSMTAQQGVGTADTPHLGSNKYNMIYDIKHDNIDD